MSEFRCIATSHKTMGITADFTKDDIKHQFDAFLDMIEQKQIERLMKLGEMCLIEARQSKGYMMQTGALLSSTGYAVYVDGVAIHRQFDAASGAESAASASGITSGQALAESLGKDTKGIALIVVAGMNYASYVEAKGYNVLASAEHLAERELPKMLNDLITNIKRAAE